MTRATVLLFALKMSGCGDSKSDDTDTDTGTDTGTDSDTGTGTGTETGTEGETGVPTGTGGEQPVELDPSGCLLQCVEDTDPQTALVDASCEVCDYDPAQHTCAALVPCVPMNEWTIPDGAEACFAVLIDADNETPSSLDNLSQACLDGGSNAEISVVRSGAAPAGTFVAVTCEWSISPAVDCPALMPGS